MKGVGYHPNLIEYKGIYIIPARYLRKDVMIEMTLGDCDIEDRITDTVYILIKKF